MTNLFVRSKKYMPRTEKIIDYSAINRGVLPGLSDGWNIYGSILKWTPPRSKKCTCCPAFIRKLLSIDG